MALAGLYDCWVDAEGCQHQTYTILTTDSSKNLQWCVRLSQSDMLSVSRIGSLLVHHCHAQVKDTHRCAAGYMTGCLSCCQAKLLAMLGSQTQMT